MSLKAKYFVSTFYGFYIDWTYTSIPGFNIESDEHTVIGGHEENIATVSKATSADFLLMGANKKSDKIYLTGNLSDYDQTQVPVTADGIYTFVRINGLTAGQTEIVKFQASDLNDTVYFADGHVNLNYTATQPVLGDTLYNDATGSFRNILSTDLVGNDSSYSTPFSGITVPNTSHPYAKLFIEDHAADGMDVLPLPVAGEHLEVVGSGGADRVYVRSGTSVDFILMGLTQGDALYFTGKLADYDQTQVSVTADGIYTFVRTSGLPVGQTEIVTFQASDLVRTVYFADGHVNIDYTAIQPVLGDTLYNDVTGTFRDIVQTDLVGDGTPGLGLALDLNGNNAGQDAIATFTEQTPVLIAPDSTLTSAYSSNASSFNATSLIVTLTSRPDGDGVESLSLNSAAIAASAGLTVSYTNATGVLSITGLAAVAVYETILQGILYNNISDTPTTSSRAISVVVDDGITSSVMHTVTLSVAAVNDAAVLSSATVNLTETDAVLSTGGTLTISDVDNPATFVAQAGTAGLYGNFTIDAAGVWTYVANSAFDSLNTVDTNTDTFTVAAVDGTTTTVTVNITGTNDAPTISSVPAGTLGATVGTAVNLADFTVADVDGDSLTVTLTPVNGAINNLTDADLVAAGIQLTGTAASINAAIAGATFTAAAAGSASIGISVTDGQLTATSTYNLNAVDIGNVAPTLTIFVTMSGASEDTAQVITFTDLTGLGDEGDVDGTVDAFIVKAVTTGTLKIGTDLASAMDFAVNANDTIDATHHAYWIPAQDVNGTAINAFTVVVRDNGGLESGTPVQLTADVTAVNDAAVLSSATENLAETDAVLSTGGTLTISDVDNPATFVAQAGTAGLYGNFTIDAAGVWTYVANSAFDSLNTVDTNTDTFTVAAADGTTTTVTVNITGTNDAPIGSATAILVAGTENTAYTINASDLLQGFTDLEGNTLSVSNLIADNGTLVNNNDSTWTFTPNANFSGGVSLTYNVTDGTASILAYQDFNVTSVVSTRVESVSLSNDTGLNPADFIVSATAATNQDIRVTLSANLVAGEGVYVSTDNGQIWTQAAATVDPAIWVLAAQTLVGSNTIKVKVMDANQVSGPEYTQQYTVDTTLPTVNVTVDAIAGNDILDTAEAGADADAKVVAITGTISGDFGIQDQVTLVAMLDGKVIGSQIAVSNGLYNIFVSGDALKTASSTSVTVVATVIELSGNTVSASSSRGYTIDTISRPDALVLNNITVNQDGLLVVEGVTAPGDTVTFTYPDLPDGSGQAVANGLGVFVYTSPALFVLNGALDIVSTDGVSTLSLLGIVLGSTSGDNLTAAITAGNDIVYGLDGDDTLKGSLGADTLNGGEDIDTLSYASDGALAGVIVNLTTNLTGSMTGIASLAQGDVISNFENVTGGSGNDAIYGNSDANILKGNVGDDLLVGGGSYLDVNTGNDSLYGGDGNDTLFGLDGNDFLQGGRGNDTLDGGTGNNTVSYNELRAGENLTVDLTFGQPNGQNAYFDYNDVNGTVTETDKLVSIANVIGGAGDDTITGSAGANSLSGGAGADLLKGSGGNDTLIGNAGDDTLEGGTGNDMLYGSLGDDSLKGGAGDNTMQGGLGDDILNGFNGGANTEGGANTYQYISSDRSAGQEDTILNFKTGDMLDMTGYLDGFKDLDFTLDEAVLAVYNKNTNTTTLKFHTYSGQVGDVDFITAPLTLLIKNYNPTGYVDGTTPALPTSLEILTVLNPYILRDGLPLETTGTQGNDILTGDYRNESLNGLGGNDLVSGNGGNDTLVGWSDKDIGGSGNDTLDGGTGNNTASYAGMDTWLNLSVNMTDTLVGGEVQIQTYDTILGAVDSIDTIKNIQNIIGGGGNDSITGDANDNIIQGRLGADTLDGGDGTDTLSYVSATTTVEIDLGSGLAAGYALGDVISNFENVTGGGGNDTLTGDAGNNVLNGSAGDDFINGSLGADTLIGSSGNDTLNGGLHTPGFGDTASYVNVRNTEKLVINLKDGTGKVYDASEIPITSTDLVDNPNLVDNANETDTLIDIQNVIGGSGDDLIIGAIDNNILQGRAGNDTLRGLAGDDSLVGGTGDDLLEGGTQNDTLVGGLGNDTLKGGAGSDTFVFVGSDHQSPTVGASDIISDLVQGETLDLTGLLAQVSDPGLGLELDDVMQVSRVGNNTILQIKTRWNADDTNFTGHVFDETTTNLTVTLKNFHKADPDSTSYTLQELDAALTILRDGLAVKATGTTGTAGDDALYGKSGNDKLQGLAGNDSLFGYASDAIAGAPDGNDTLIGGSGNDTLDGGLGNNTASYEGQDTWLNLSVNMTDTLVGGEVQIQTYDTILGAVDSIDTIKNIQNIIGGGGNDSITGDANDNIIQGRLGADTLDGGDGTDTLSYVSATTTVEIDLGSGLAAGYALGDVISNFENVTGGGGNDTLTGDAGNNVLNGSAGDDFINGSLGADTLIGGIGNDTLNGGLHTPGFGDTASYAAVKDNLQINLGLGNGFVYQEDGEAIYETDTLIDIQNVIGGSGDDLIIGAIDNNILQGRAGNDTLRGLAGDDSLVGGTGADLLEGGTQNDTLVGGLGNDTLKGGAGSDTFAYELADRQAPADNATDTILDFNLATDKIDLTGLLSTLSANPALFFEDVIKVTIVGNDTELQIMVDAAAPLLPDDSRDFSGRNLTLLLVGGQYSVADINSAILRNGLLYAPVINGTEGNDSLTGTAAIDRIYGMGGNDTIVGGLAADVIDGGLGINTASYAADTASITVALGAAGVSSVVTSADGNDTIVNIQNIIAGAGNDSIAGSSEDNALEGGNGNDTISGGNGSDTLDGGLGTDSLTGGAGDDTLIGGLGADTLDGGAGSNTASYVGYNAPITVTVAITGTSFTVTSTDGNDTLNNIQNVIGGAGNDNISGSVENNILMGGAGIDTLFGDLGNDTLSGGTGIDLLKGGKGDDTYLFNLGDGNDTISASINDLAASNTLIFGAGIGESNVHMQVAGSGNVDLIITLGNTDSNGVFTWNGQDEITVVNENLATFEQINKVIFADSGLIWNINDLQSKATYEGTLGNDVKSYWKFEGANSAGNLMHGGDGNDSLTGWGTQDALNGNVGKNDTLYGDAGDDTLIGDAGNDSLIGGTGSDYLRGGDGNDTYLFNLGDGNDTITAGVSSLLSGSNTIQFGTGIGESNVHLNRVYSAGHYSLEVTLGYTDISNVFHWNGQDKITVNLQDFSQYEQISAITFNDSGVTWALADILDKSAYDGTTSNDNIVGTTGNDTLYGGGGNDTLDGGAGNDTLYGGAGDETLVGNTGNDFLSGGAGSDTLNGGAGNDTYAFGFGDGNDIVGLGMANNASNSPFDNTIELATGVGVGNVHLNRVMNGSNGFDLEVLLGTTDVNGVFTWNGQDKITAIRQDLPLLEQITQITFKDLPGVVLSLSDILGMAAYDGTSGADSITGTAGNDSLYGGGSNDTLIGGSGNDTLRGGVGADIVRGGLGNDTYLFGLGDGHDSIGSSSDFNSGNAGSLNVLKLDAGIAPSDLILTDAYIAATNTHDLTISLATSAFDTLTGLYADSLYISGENNSSYEGIQQIQFTNLDGTPGATWNIATIFANSFFNGTAGDDYQNAWVYPTTTGGSLMYGNGGKDSLAGGSYSDTLYGGTGNDTLDGGYGSDTLYGGAGNDSLKGNDGSDVYHFGVGDGNDTINDSPNGTGENTLILDGLFTPANIQLTRVLGGNNLLLTLLNNDGVTPTGDTVLINNETTLHDGIYTLSFGDGNTAWSWDKATIVANTITQGTAASESITSWSYGTVGSNIHGNGGNDTLNGSTYNDSLYGGIGNDRLDGGNGDDYLVAGGGADILNGGVGNDIIVINTDNLSKLSAPAGVAGVDYATIAGSVGGQATIDTLRFSGDVSDQTLDITAIRALGGSRLVYIDVFDITGGGDNTIHLNLADVLAISPAVNDFNDGNGWDGLGASVAKKQVVVDGDAGDQLIVGDAAVSWTLAAGTATHGADTYKVYNYGTNAQLLVNDQMSPTLFG